LKKKILIATTVAETFVTILKDQPNFLSQYYDVHIVTSVDGYYTKILKHGITVHNVSMHRKISLIKDIVSLYKMILLIFSLKPDIVHSYTPKAGLMSMLSSLICLVPVRVHTFTGLIFPTQTSLFRYILLIADRIIAYASTNILAEGKGVQSDLLKFKITSTIPKIIANGNIAGVDTNFYDSKNIDNSIFESKCTNFAELYESLHNFSFFGRLCKDKGICELIDAFISINISDVNLILFGAYDKTAPLSAKILSKIENHPRIYQMGYVDDVRSCMINVDSVILPSYREGFPNVLLQAGSMKKLLIATDISGCNEIILHNETGFLIPPKCISSLSEAMKKVVFMKKEELLAIQNRCRSRICNLYDVNHFRKSLLKFYRSVL
jgi:glycosyltransferase involved in cell wall biosynthesis